MVKDKNTIFIKLDRLKVHYIINQNKDVRKGKSGNMYWKYAMFYSVIMLFTIGCASQKKQPPKLLVEMSRSPCMGVCPVYTLQVYDNGLVQLVGEKNIEQIGTYQAMLTSEELTALKKQFDELEFFSLKDEYIKRVSDLPTTHISYTQGDQTKRIKDYYGAPEGLRNLEKYIHNYLN